MSKFFVSNKVYEDRIAICKPCIYYLSLLGNCKICGCFMKVKARISNQSCPKGYWDKTTAIKPPKELPKEMIEEVINVGGKLLKGRFQNHEVKKNATELYNTIHNTNYSTGTNCNSCLATIYDGIKKLYQKYNQ